MGVGIKAGDRVVGKSTKTSGKRGIVEIVLKEKRQHTYDVLWDSGQRERVSAHSIAVETTNGAIMTARDRLKVVVFSQLSCVSRERSKSSFSIILLGSCDTKSKNTRSSTGSGH